MSLSRQIVEVLLYHTLTGYWYLIVVEVVVGGVKLSHSFGVDGKIEKSLIKVLKYSIGCLWESAEIRKQFQQLWGWAGLQLVKYGPVSLPTGVELIYYA